MDKQKEILSKIKHIPRKFKLIGIVLLSPFLLFLLLATLIYLPPIQEWAKNKTCQYLSEETGMNINIEKLRLSFPIDLALYNTRVTKEKDTVVSAEKVLLNIPVLPIFRGTIALDGFEITNAKIDSRDLVGSAHLEGQIGYFGICIPTNYHLSSGNIQIGPTYLKHSQLAVSLIDTTIVDTTQSTPPQNIIHLNKIALVDNRITFKMPNDSMAITTHIEKAEVLNANADLAKNDYRAKVASLLCKDLQYDLPYTTRKTEGLDINHLHFSPIGLKANNIVYSQGKLSADLENLNLTEQCGLKLDKMSAKISYDSTLVNIKNFYAKSSSSHLSGNIYLPMSTLRNGGGGSMKVNLTGHLFYKDFLDAVPQYAKQIRQYCPDEELELEALITGNVDEMSLQPLKAKLGSTLSLNISGKAYNVLSEQHRKLEADCSIKSDNLSFYKPLLPASIKIPQPLLLNSKIGMVGNVVSIKNNLRSGRGNILLNGSINISTLAYTLQAQAKQFPLTSWLKEIPLSPLTAKAQAKGKGFDFNSSKTSLDSKIDIQKLSYGTIPLNNLHLNLGLRNKQIDGSFNSNNEMLNADSRFQFTLGKDDLRGRLRGAINDFSLAALTGNTQDSLHVSSRFGVGIFTKYNISALAGGILLEDLKFITENETYNADSIGLLLRTNQDSTFARLRSGDLKIRLACANSLNQMIDGFSLYADSLMSQIGQAHINQQSLKALLPEMQITAEAGKKNPLYKFLSYSGNQFSKIDGKITTHSEKGINGNLEISKLQSKKLLLEKILFSVSNPDNALKVEGTIENKGKKNPNRFLARLNAEVEDNGFSLNALFKDEKNKEGLNFGVRGETSNDGSVSMHIFPEVSTIAYRKFKVNKDNFVTFTPQRDILANVDLLADDKTGLKFIATKEDETNDFSLSINHVNISELCSVMPSIPTMSGFLNTDLHILKSDSSLSASGDINLDKFKYESYNMGNIGAQIVFLPNSDNEYYLNALLQADKKEVGYIDGTYTSTGSGQLDAEFALTEFPAKLINAFLPDDGTLALDGKMNGTTHIEGPTDAFKINGNIQPDSLVILSPLYGLNLKVENKAIEIEDNVVNFNNINMFSQNAKNPLLVNGTVDFQDFEKIKMDMKVKAKNFELVNSEKTSSSVLYGKVYSDIDIAVMGSTQFMRINGYLNVLGKTSMTYIMKDSPITANDYLSDLVEFQDFSDTTTVKESQSTSSKMMMDIKVNINESARFHCDLDESGNSYFDGKGGGNLSLKYMPNGSISIIGKLALASGKLKYELPFIPLKTFTLNGDNYILFTGDPMNPTLHLTAMEKIKASVNDGESSMRMVNFNVGVALSQTLSNMGLQFLIEAPDDMRVQNDLASMSDEGRGKLAVTMLATGMYLSSTNKSSFQANNALNAFLQSEIQNIAGKALRTIDLTVGVEGGASATGENTTDYSFQFSKHLWNDRVTFIIGGKVSTGAQNANENQSFIDNISLEYRIDKNSTRYLKVFYDHDTHDPLEGTYSSSGVGYVLRNKATRFGDLFIFKRKKKNDLSISPNEQPTLIQNKKE